MISAFALAYQVLHEKRFLDAATAATHFILTKLRKNDSLLRRYRDGEALIPGTLEDYAALVAAVLDVYEASFDPQWLREALRLNDRMVELFWDRADGGFFFNPRHETELPASIKEAYDGPIPSGNSIAAENLLRLAALTNNEDLQTRAKEIFLTFRTLLEQTPLEHTQMLCALDFYLSPPMQVVLAAEKRENAQPFATEIARHFLPNKVIVCSQSGVTELEVPALVPLIKDKVPLQGHPTVYICKNYTCKRPITELEELRRVLAHRKV